MQKAQGPGVCKLPKPPASRALCQAKRAPRAAFPSGCFAAQTKRWAEGIRVPAPLAGLRIFRAVKLFCKTLQWCINVIIHLPQPRDYPNSKNEPRKAGLPNPWARTGASPRPVRDGATPEGE